jgi:hypothetical protein
MAVFDGSDDVQMCLELPDAPFDGDTYEPDKDHVRLRGQNLRVFTLMRDGLWRTLGEISEGTGDPEASVSARLRDFRKKKFGGHTVESRRRGPASDGLWEYRLP